MKGRITMHQGKNSPPGILDGSLSLEFESRLNFNCLKSFLAVSLFTVVDDSFELQSFKVARSDFWVTMPFNFEQLELHYYKSNRKSNLSAVLEKDKISNWVHFTMIWVTIATKWRHASFHIRPNNLPPEIISEIRRRDLGLDIVVSTMAKL